MFSLNLPGVPCEYVSQKLSVLRQLSKKFVTVKDVLFLAFVSLAFIFTSILMLLLATHNGIVAVIVLFIVYCGILLLFRWRWDVKIKSYSNDVAELITRWNYELSKSETLAEAYWSFGEIMNHFCGGGIKYHVAIEKSLVDFPVFVFDPYARRNMEFHQPDVQYWKKKNILRLYAWLSS